MAFVRNVKKPSRVVRALKQMKSKFLSKPDSQMLFCRKTKFVFENYKGDQPLHPKIILGKSCHTLTSHIYHPVNCSTTAKFHHLAENALMTWAMCNKNEVIFKPTDPESISGLRNYAKEVDGKGAPPVDAKKPNATRIDESVGAERFAEAKRILKEKRISKEMNNRKKSPFEEP
ncbi:uncharacterized protein isoform X1 [Choristoneura fumiferana]|uniref:uncharacterized protein isoform X1 n=1 Tax=Choristoneura fumiferana TaxID=7141 RepID=UPI003D15E6DF